MTTPKKPLVIGVTGGIGSGKSSVARLLAECSGIVVDADQIAHEALRQSEILGRVVAQFGTTVIGPDGAIDRKGWGRSFLVPPKSALPLKPLCSLGSAGEFIRNYQRPARAPIAALLFSMRPY